MTSRVSTVSFGRKQLSQCSHGSGCPDWFASNPEPGRDAVVEKYYEIRKEKYKLFGRSVGNVYI